MPSGLAERLGKREPFGSREQELTLLLWRTSDLVLLAWERHLRRWGITASQYNVLRILAGEARPLTVGEIAARTITQVPGITGVLDRLVSAGWVERHRLDTDRRVVRCQLTAASRQLLDDLAEPVMAFHRSQVEGLSIAEQDQLLALLERWRKTIDAPTDPESASATTT